MSIIQNWEVVLKLPKGDAYKSPEQLIAEAKVVINGQIYGDSRFEDSHNVTTGSLIKLDPINKVAKTKRTTYQLGIPNPKWVEFLKTINATPLDYKFSTENN